MVKIYQVEHRPDYDNPWDRHGPQTSSGSGCIISGNRILTSAHVVSNTTFLQVQRHGQAKKYTARVVAAAHDADLAILTVDDPRFFQGITPLPFGALPEVQDAVVVYGFPEGGVTLSTTMGVVSRMEHITYVHSTLSLLAAQLDAAINPGNSGGPVLVQDHIVGVAMQSLTSADNIAYMVPAPIIAHVLADLDDGRYDGFPELGLHTQALDNASLKRQVAGRDNVSGVLVTHILPGSPADGVLLPGDVLLAVDGHAIADDGTIAFRRRARTSFAYAIQQHQLGEMLTLRILRAGQTQTRQVRLEAAAGAHELVPGSRYDRRPSYYIYGGLVLCPLTLDYLRTWGETWTTDAPTQLLNYYVNGRASEPEEEVVLLIKVLPAALNTGYEVFVNQRIVAVNDQKIRNLRELVRAVEQPASDPFIVLTTEANARLVFDRAQAQRDHRTLLATYDIAWDRSEDLRQPQVDPRATLSQLP
jgi:S1-C subfamily serine protease